MCFVEGPALAAEHLGKAAQRWTHPRRASTAQAEHHAEQLSRSQDYLGYWFYTFFPITCIFPIGPHNVDRLHKPAITPCYSAWNSTDTNRWDLSTRFPTTSEEKLSQPQHLPASYLLPGAPTCTDLSPHSWTIRIAPETQNPFCHLLLASAISSLLFWPSGLDLKQIKTSYQTWPVLTPYLSHETRMEHSSSFSTSLHLWWHVYL